MNKAITKSALKIEKGKSEFAEKLKAEWALKSESLPMPLEKNEDWRYTRIEKIKLEIFSGKDTKVIVHGIEEAKSKGVIIEDIFTALEKNETARKYFLSSINKEDKFSAIAASKFENGLFIHVPKDTILLEPITAEFEIGKESAICNLIVVEPNSQVDYSESYIGNNSSSLVHTEVFANQNSKINFSHINNWQDSTSIANISGTVEKDAGINWMFGCFGGKLNRIRNDTYFAGNGSNATNIGVYLGKKKEHIDITTNAHHLAQNTTNNIMMDGILKDSSSSVYRGLILIDKIAQKTNSYLSNHTLKIGQNTLANSIPSLKIDANDVKASHGATMGQISEEHLFYLMSRGLSKEGAEKLIVEGFFEPIIAKIKSEDLKNKITEMIGK